MGPGNSSSLAWLERSRERTKVRQPALPRPEDRLYLPSLDLTGFSKGFILFQIGWSSRDSSDRGVALDFIQRLLFLLTTLVVSLSPVTLGQGKLRCHHDVCSCVINLVVALGGTRQLRLYRQVSSCILVTETRYLILYWTELNSMHIQLLARRMTGVSSPMDSFGALRPRVVVISF